MFVFLLQTFPLETTIALFNPDLFLLAAGQIWHVFGPTSVGGVAQSAAPPPPRLLVSSSCPWRHLDSARAPSERKNHTQSERKRSLGCAVIGLDRPGARPIRSAERRVISGPERTKFTRGGNDRGCHRRRRDERITRRQRREGPRTTQAKASG